MGGGGSPWGQAARGHPDSLCNVRGPTSSATCVASSLPSLVAATLGDRAGQDQEEEGQSRDRQKVPATAACLRCCRCRCCLRCRPGPGPQPAPQHSAGIFGSLDAGSGPDPPAISPKEQGHEKVRLGQGMQGWGWGGDMAPSNLGQGKLARDLEEGRGLQANQMSLPPCPSGTVFHLLARALSLTAPFLGFYTLKPPKPPIPLTHYPVPSCA